MTNETEFFDTHAHLDDEQLGDDLDAVIERARAARVATILAVGTTAASSTAAVRIAETYHDVYAAVGIQPNYSAEAGEEQWDHILQLAQNPRVRALGETGLDAYWDFTPFKIQREWFDRHLRLSQDTGLPFIVHMRDCGDATVEMLRAARVREPLRGVMHSFTGDAATLHACLEVGLYISFAGMVTFKKSTALREIALQVPADRILIETDSPYLSPHPRRGHRPNEPALLVHTAQCLADARQTSLEEFAGQTTANARALFGVPSET